MSAATAIVEPPRPPSASTTVPSGTATVAPTLEAATAATATAAAVTNNLAATAVASAIPSAVMATTAVLAAAATAATVTTAASAALTTAAAAVETGSGTDGGSSPSSPVPTQSSTQAESIAAYHRAVSQHIAELIRPIASTPTPIPLPIIRRLPASPASPQATPSRSSSRARAVELEADQDFWSIAPVSSSSAQAQSSQKDGPCSEVAEQANRELDEDEGYDGRKDVQYERRKRELRSDIRGWWKGVSRQVPYGIIQDPPEIPDPIPSPSIAYAYLRRNSPASLAAAAAAAATATLSSVSSSSTSGVTSHTVAGHKALPPPPPLISNGSGSSTSISISSKDSNISSNSTHSKSSISASGSGSGSAGTGNGRPKPLPFTSASRSATYIPTAPTKSKVVFSSIVDLGKQTHPSNGTDAVSASASASTTMRVDGPGPGPKLLTLFGDMDVSSLSPKSRCRRLGDGPQSQSSASRCGNLTAVEARYGRAGDLPSPTLRSTTI